MVVGIRKRTGIQISSGHPIRKKERKGEQEFDLDTHPPFFSSTAGLFYSLPVVLAKQRSRFLTRYIKQTKNNNILTPNVLEIFPFHFNTFFQIRIRMLQIPNVNQSTRFNDGGGQPEKPDISRKGDKSLLFLSAGVISWRGTRLILGSKWRSAGIDNSTPEKARRGNTDY